MTSLCHDPSERFPTTTVSLAGPLFRQLLAGVLNDGKVLRFTALGRSMHPTIRHGDLLTLLPVTSRRPRWGDVVAVVSDPVTEKVIVHRIVRLTSDTVETRGDALGCSDGIFPRTALLGVVTRISRNGKAVGRLSAIWPFIPPPIRGIALGVWRIVHKLMRILYGRLGK